MVVIVGLWSLAFGRFFIGRWSSVVGHCLLDCIRCSLYVGRCSLVAGRLSLFASRCCLV